MDVTKAEITQSRLNAPLREALLPGNRIDAEKLQSCLDGGANPNQVNAAQTFAESGNDELLQMLLEYKNLTVSADGPPPETIKVDVNQVSEKGETIAEILAQAPVKDHKARVESFKALLEAGANLNERPIIHKVALAGNVPIFKTLMDLGADSTRKWKGKTAIELVQDKIANSHDRTEIEKGKKTLDALKKAEMQWKQEQWKRIKSLVTEATELSPTKAPVANFPPPKIPPGIIWGPIQDPPKPSLESDADDPPIETPDRIPADSKKRANNKAPHSP